LSLPVVEQRIPREMLYTADEAFFTGTVAEITPVKGVDGKPVGAGARGPVTERIQRRFFSTLRGELDDRHGWMTVV
jgi:branched-chain amino acid aminotransferase